MSKKSHRLQQNQNMTDLGTNGRSRKMDKQARGARRNPGRDTVQM